MKKSIILILLLSISLSAQDFKTLKRGVEYAEQTREISGTKVRMNLLRLDLKKVRLDVVHAFDRAVGVEKTSEIAARHKAFAAINAGFFRLDTSAFAGEAAGALRINWSLLSESYADRSALGIIHKGPRTSVVFGRLHANATIGESPDDALDGINRERKKGEAILYTPEMGETPKSETPITEFIFRSCKIVCREVTSIQSYGGTKVFNGGYVIAVDADGMEKATVKELVRRVNTRSSGFLFGAFKAVGADDSRSKLFEKSEDIVAGVPQLVRNGRVDVTWQDEKSSRSFFETKHPRTAVALLKDGKFLMITVDGRSESSGGIGLEDLAKLLVEFGAVDALNLDGGGSTTMYVDGKVVNHPSDKEGERKVSDALLVFPRTK